MISSSPKINSFIIQLIGVALISSCAVAPVNSHYESASTLEKKQLEISGHYEKYDATYDGEAEKTNYNFGGQVGYGFGNNFDLKLRYSRLTPFAPEDDPDIETTKYNYINLSPKYTIIPEILAVKLPFSMYWYKEEGYSAEQIFALSPAVLGTFPISQSFDITLSSQYQIALNEDESNYLGFALGIGLSSNLDVWALRPELGYQFNPATEQQYLNYGLALLYHFNLK